MEKGMPVIYVGAHEDPLRQVIRKAGEGERRSATEGAVTVAEMI